MKKLLLFIMVLTFTTLNAHRFEEAYSMYQKGEAAEQLSEREYCFNQALKYYSEYEFPNGKLYYNIGNCYYQLNQIGMAIWYYHKALHLLPRDAKIKENLQKAQQLANVPESLWDKIGHQLLFWHYSLSPSEQTRSFIIFSLLAFIFGSLFIWFKKALYKYLAIVFLVSCAAFGSSRTWEHYHSKVAVFIQPALLRCDAGMQYKEVDQELIVSGQKVKVLEVSPDAEWLKVQTHDHKTGYVAAKQVRLL